MKKKKNRKTAPPINIKHEEPMAAESLNSIKNLIDAGHQLSGINIQDKCRETINLLLKKVVKNPDDYPAYFYLSQLYMNVKDESSGIEYAEKCLSILQQIKNNSHKSSNDLSFYYSIYHILALALISQKNYDKALDIIKERLEKLPDDIDLLYDLACAGYFLNDPSLIIKGGEPYLNLISRNENIDNIELSNKDKNLIISTTSQSAIFSVKCWLIIAYIQINNTDGFAKLWEEMKLQIKEQTENEQPSDYKNIALTFLVIIAESLLTQNQSRKFLEISSFILTTCLEHQLDSIKGASELASAYNMLAQQQDKTEQGITVALSSLNIAWILTDDNRYLDSIKKIKMNNFQTLEEITQPALNRQPAHNQSSASAIIESNKSQNITPAFFRTAFAEVDITPKISDANPVFLQGMAGKERKAIGVGSPLKMQMLLIEDKNQTKILFVAADIFGFGSEMVELVRKAAYSWGIPPEGIILNASHTHYAPGTLSHTFRTMGPFFKEYAMEIAGIVGNSISMLHNNLEESYIYSGKTDVSIGVKSILNNSGKIDFQPDSTGNYDQHTPFLLLEQKKSHKKIIMVNHGCQPKGLGIEENVSADFPGYFREELIKSGKIDHVMYLQGASGDIKEAFTLNGCKVFSQTSEETQINGKIMAKRIESTLDYGQLIPLTESIISYTNQIMYLRLKKIPDINRINELKIDILSSPVVREWASRLSSTYPSGDFPNALALDMQVAVIGKIATFICFPAGPVTDIGIKLKKLTEYPETTFILGYTNGLICYLPDDNAISQGGYESDISPYYYMIPYPLAKEVDAEITATFKQCYSKIEVTPI